MRRYSGSRSRSLAVIFCLIEVTQAANQFRACALVRLTIIAPISSTDILVVLR